MRRFAFDLRAGEYLELAVSQEEADLVATLRGPGRPEDLRLDTATPVRAQVPERVRFVAAEGGAHVLEIAGDSQRTAGRFRISIEVRRPATGLDRRAAHALGQLAAAEKLRRAKSPESDERALPLYKEAAQESAAIGDRAAEAYTRIQQAGVLARGGRQNQAVTALRRAFALTAPEREPALRALAATELARLLPSLGLAGEAPALLEEALGLWRRLGVGSRVAQVENELGLRAQERGELAEAERLFLAAIADWKAVGEGYQVALVTANLSTLYGTANEGRLALDTILRAEAQLAADTPAADRAWFLAKRGEALARLGRFEEAEKVLLAGRELHVRDRDASAGPALFAIAQVDRRLGQLAYQLGRSGEAVARYRAALAGFQKVRDRPGEIGTVQDLAWAELKRGHLDTAEQIFASVPARARQIDDRWIEAAAFVGLARVEQARGRPARALVQARKALRLAEDLRQDAGRADFGTSVFADRQIYFDLAAELLVERFRKTGDSAFATEAFEVAERSRARRLLDLLAPGPYPAAPAGPNRMEPTAARAVARAEERLRRLRDIEATNEQIAAAEGDLREAVLALRRATARRELPRLSAAPRSLAAIRRALDSQTVLLEFDLGDDESYLWMVTGDDLQLFPLPGREQIEQRVAQALEVLSDPGVTSEGVQARQVLDGTTKLLFGAALTTLRAPRWLIVADGALLALPLGALPDPRDPDRPILASREVVYAPSASVAVQLAERVRRQPAKGPELAMFADPIYGADDERLGSAAARTEVGDDEARALDLPRLLESGEEARRILALVPPGRRIEALGVDANKDRILAGDLAQVRRLHFAVHGLPNREHPELSSLALSHYGSDGRPRDGMLHAYEIAGLHLDADLAVLSACQSGQGTQVAGEGLVGLAHAFLAAGTGRVVASYWPIQDAATAELMTRFYDGLLRRNLSPSRALQQAQLSMAADARWRRPYYWAGFSVQGGF